MQKSMDQQIVSSNKSNTFPVLSRSKARRYDAGQYMCECFDTYRNNHTVHVQISLLRFSAGPHNFYWPLVCRSKTSAQTGDDDGESDTEKEHNNQAFMGTLGLLRADCLHLFSRVK